jgi:predicted KAP-like P-loop ATPase
MPVESANDVRAAIEKIDLQDSSQITYVLISEGISEISEEEIIELIDNIDFESFTPEESAQIMQALTNAPDDVKKVFEEEVNIFADENFSTYVPTGSLINVAQRRALVAAGAAMTAIGAAVSSSGGTRGGSRIK